MSSGVETQEWNFWVTAHTRVQLLSILPNIFLKQLYHVKVPPGLDKNSGCFTSLPTLDGDIFFLL